MQTAARTLGLARDLGIGRIHAVSNKVSATEDLGFIRDNLVDLPVIAALPFDGGLEGDARCSPPYG